MLGIGVIEIIILGAAAWYFSGMIRRMGQRHPHHTREQVFGAPRVGSRNLKSALFIGSVGALVVFVGLAATWTTVKLAPVPTPTFVTQHYGSDASGTHIEVGHQHSSVGTVSPYDPIEFRPRLFIWSYGKIAMLTFGIGLVVAFFTRRRTNTTSWSVPSHRKSQFLRGVVKGIVCLGLVGAAFLVIYRMRAAGPVSAVTFQNAVQETIEAAPFDSPVIQQNGVAMHHGNSPVWVTMPIGVFGLLAIFFSAWSLTWMFSKGSTATAASPGHEEATEPKFAWGWLVIPTMCFAGVLYQSFAVFYPAPQAYYPDRYDDFPQRYERMYKSIKDYTDSQLKTAEATSQPHGWLVAAANKTLEADHIALASGPYSTAKEAEEELLPAVQDLVEREFHKLHPWQGEWKVPLPLIRERVIESTVIHRESKTIGKFSGDLFQAFMNVDLSPDVLQTFEPTWKAAIVERRLLGMGLILGWIASQLLLCAAYFHSQGSNPRAGRWRWKLAATGASVGLALVAGYWLDWIVKVM
jgi:hypothetical protein